MILRSRPEDTRIRLSDSRTNGFSIHLRLGSASKNSLKAENTAFELESHDIHVSREVEVKDEQEGRRSVKWTAHIKIYKSLRVLNNSWVAHQLDKMIGDWFNYDAGCLWRLIFRLMYCRLSIVTCDDREVPPFMTAPGFNSFCQPIINVNKRSIITTGDLWGFSRKFCREKRRRKRKTETEKLKAASQESGGWCKISVSRKRNWTKNHVKQISAIQLAILNVAFQFQKAFLCLN